MEHRVRQAVAARRVTDPAPDDPYRGLYLTPEGVQRVLSMPRQPHTFAAAGDFDVPEAGSRLLDVWPGASTWIRWTWSSCSWRMAPDVDARFERLYGYLNDDVTRRRATVGLALELCGQPAAGPGRFRFAAAAPLVAGGLLEVTGAAAARICRGCCGCRTG